MFLVEAAPLATEDTAAAELVKRAVQADESESEAIVILAQAEEETQTAKQARPSR